MRPESSRQCWELEVRNLPDHCNKDDLVHFLWKSMDLCRALMKPTNPVIPSIAQITQSVLEDRMLVINFRSFEEAVNCLQMDHIYYVNNRQIRARKCYQ